jgi:hypothetical protein
MLMAQSSLTSAGTSIYGSSGQISFRLSGYNHTILNKTAIINFGILQANNFSPIEVLHEDQILTWPNPVIESLNIKLDSNPASPVSFQIYDLNGQLWGNYSFSEKNSSVSMHSYPSGTYLLKIISPQQIPITKKINKL